MSRSFKFSSVLIAALAFAAACGDDGDDGASCASMDTYQSYGKALIDGNCIACHSAALDMSKQMNVKLQTVEGIRAAKSHIIEHAVDLKVPVMPMAGPLPAADRMRLKAWLDCDAP